MCYRLATFGWELWSSLWHRKCSPIRKAWLVGRTRFLGIDLLLAGYLGMILPCGGRPGYPKDFR